MDVTLEDFLAEAAFKRQKEDIRFHWHIRAFSEADIPLPWEGTDSYNYVEGETEEETLAILGRVARFAVENHLDVEKSYDHDFQLKVTVSQEPRVVIRYSANREAVCTKKVVGTKKIPAHTIPERTEDIVEWDCPKVSLLAAAKEEG